MTDYNEPLKECPNCGSDYLEEKDTFFKNNTMTQSIVCNDCEHSWNEIWTFNRIEEKQP